MNEQPPRKRKKVRVTHIVFLTLAVAATLGLAYWQWTRFRAGTGTFQNLGYAIQWPAFGAFIVYAYRRYIQLENEYSETGMSPVELEKQRKAEVTEIDESFLPERPTMNVEEFNAQNEPRRRRRNS
ncbi:hypothetical protein HW450_10235 [Corynebacterium hindlerae]|uniref:Uncharacterized protein n=1 Tax=Corynebacterium hindlerae TaxID=699041 RepID=A0A7G5FIT5_9CORY|nr:hypothetical protein [Corynebacterium hindlerae]QMV86526.1 hypothetical protein HW450_10235 [Corynebacterium hindlerae]QTH60864.1 hypothetical protein J5O04_11410 [Corynebacterium hindlerae]